MKISIITLGCKVNQAESASLERRVSETGHTLVNVDADAYIVNTCAVTAEAARKSRQAIRKVQAHGKPVYVAGCYPKIDKTEMETLGVTPLELSPLSELLSSSGEAGGKPAKRSRALLKIQDGCENYCSYCIIPFARGRCKSLPIENAVAQVERFLSEGVKETIITGIEIASYGKDLPEKPDLSEIVREIAAKVPKMRLQLGSLEPRVITREFCEAIQGKVVGKFHLSLQSGCDSVLRRMNRRYDTARFTDSVTLLREFFPGAFLSADVIVGFPGETDAEFNTGVEFVRSCGFDHLHVFPYSPRPGTKAAEMDGQIDKSVKKARAELMRGAEKPV
ncbi:MAG: radical SAM protein [Oscillospiraceae bacterium]|jgi:threonylcarbamoyladenosine tRNA methylthiotransferase MtaB|nr:radical SAM protein [Oscillospiraceae bacterium]